MFYRTPDLRLLGQVNVDGAGCRRSPVPDRLVCGDAPSGTEHRLAVVDATTFVIVATPADARGAAGSGVEATDLVPGAAGQVALRFNTNSFGSPSDSLWLFTSPALP